MKKTAHFFSIAFHPLLLPTFVFVLLGFLYPYFNTPYNSKHFIELSTFIFICTFIFPAVAIYAMYKWEVIGSLFLEERKDRPYPMVLTSLMYLLFTKILFGRIGADQTFIHAMYFIGFLILLAGIITFFWKISAHALGVGGVSGFFIQLNTQVLDNRLFVALLVILAISGLVMTARLLLKAHTPTQVYIGYTIGMVFGFFMHYL